MVWTAFITGYSPQIKQSVKLSLSGVISKKPWRRGWLGPENIRLIITQQERFSFFLCSPTAARHVWKRDSHRGRECDTPGSGRSLAVPWTRMLPCGSGRRCRRTAACPPAGWCWRETTSTCRNSGVSSTQPGGAPENIHNYKWLVKFLNLDDFFPPTHSVMLQAFFCMLWEWMKNKQTFKHFYSWKSEKYGLDFNWTCLEAQRSESL